MIKEKRRPDGRKFDQIRDIWIEVGVLPRTHGSAIFTRGETQALVTTTLGTSDDMQRLEAFEGEAKKRFMLHYNFPPFSVGESQRSCVERAVARLATAHWLSALSQARASQRHGLALRDARRLRRSGVERIVVDQPRFCGASLAPLMDAGVPLRGFSFTRVRHGTGEGRRRLPRSSPTLRALEDHYGDMDFKVAGTREGITALQMDIKVMGHHLADHASRRWNRRARHGCTSSTRDEPGDW